MGNSLAEKLVFITGAGGGIGKAACKILALESASIIAADINIENAQKTVANLVTNGKYKHTAIKLNVTDEDDVRHALTTVLDEYKTVPDVVINLAGLYYYNTLYKITTKEIDELISVNLKGTILVVKFFSEAMVDHGLKSGSILNCSSFTSKFGTTRTAIYAAAKAGIDGFTRCVAKELGKHGIRVNCIVPGFVDTPMISNFPLPHISSLVALQRIGTPEEIGELIAFLASDKSSYITGASFDINGGY